jgi:hypothetical protein
MSIWSCCIKDVDPVLINFDNNIDLQSVNSSISSSDIGEIVDFRVVDSLLVINETFNDYIFKIFNLNNGKLITQNIKKGKGPDEMISARAFGYYKNDIIVSYIENQKKMIYISLKDMLNQHNHFMKVKEVAKGDSAFIFKCYPINDNLVMCTGVFDKGRYCMVDFESGNWSVKYDYPYDVLHKNEGNDIKAFAFQGEISVKPDFSKFAFATSSSGNLEFFNIENNDFNKFFEKSFYLPEYKGFKGRGAASLKSNKNGFISIASSNKYVYILYSGRSKMEYGNQSYCANNILVYDWEGSPILNLKVDNLLRDMTLDLNNHKIYGYCIDNENGEPKIVKYDLPIDLR